MNAEISLKLYELTQDFIKDNNKAKLFVSKIEETIDKKFDDSKDVFLTKNDKIEIIKTIYVVGLVQFLAIVGSVLAIVTFAFKLN
jgi:hypothetical protein